MAELFLKAIVLLINIMISLVSKTLVVPHVTLQEAKAAVFFGCLPGDSLGIADAEQAYIQADTKATPLGYVCPQRASELVAKILSKRASVLFAVLRKHFTEFQMLERIRNKKVKDTCDLLGPKGHIPDIMTNC